MLNVAALARNRTAIHTPSNVLLSILGITLAVVRITRDRVLLLLLHLLQSAIDVQLGFKVVHVDDNRIVSVVFTAHQVLVELLELQCQISNLEKQINSFRSNSANKSLGLVFNKP